MPAVVDANVFIRGKTNLEFDELYTVPSVEEELESAGARTSFEVRDVQVKEPSTESLERVREKSEEINSPTSEADEALLALALDTGAVLVTDDMALQNLALHLDVEFQSYMGEEAEEKRSWIKVCGNCSTEVSGDECPRCGSTRFQRKPC